MKSREILKRKKKQPYEYLVWRIVFRGFVVLFFFFLFRQAKVFPKFVMNSTGGQFEDLKGIWIFVRCFVKLLGESGRTAFRQHGWKKNKKKTNNPTDTEVAHFSLCDTEKPKKRRKKKNKTISNPKFNLINFPVLRKKKKKKMDPEGCTL